MSHRVLHLGCCLAVALLACGSSPDAEPAPPISSSDVASAPPGSHDVSPPPSTATGQGPGSASTAALPSSDPFDPTSCSGPALSMGEYHATFPLPPQGLGGVVAVHGQLVRWYRACNADRCGDWSTPSVIGPTNLSYTLRTDAQGHEIGADVAMTTERSNNAGGYDHTWVALEVRLPALLARAGNATATHEGNGYAMPGIGRTADAFEGLSAIVTKACVRVAGVEVHRDNSFQPAAKTGEVAFAVVLRP